MINHRLGNHSRQRKAQAGRRSAPLPRQRRTCRGAAERRRDADTLVQDVTLQDVTSPLQDVTFSLQDVNYYPQAALQTVLQAVPPARMITCRPARHRLTIDVPGSHVDSLCQVLDTPEMQAAQKMIALQIPKDRLFDAFRALPMEQTTEERAELLRLRETLPIRFQSLLDTSMSYFGGTMRGDTTLGTIAAELATTQDGGIVTMDCACFAATLDSVFRQRPGDEVFATSVQGKHDKSFMQHALYLGPGASTYEQLCNLPECDPRGEWIIRPPGCDKYLGMGTHPRLLTLPEWAALATHSLGTYVETHLPQTNEFRGQLDRRLMIRQLLECGCKAKIDEYTKLLLPRVCYNSSGVFHDYDGVDNLVRTTRVIGWDLITKHNEGLDRALSFLISQPIADWRDILEMPELESCE